MRTRVSGYCLVELLVVLGIVGVFAALGGVSLTRTLVRHEARGCAQETQAASAWAQLGVLWWGGTCELSVGGGTTAVGHDRGLCGGRLGTAGESPRITSNISRWTSPFGVALRFVGAFACPDSGGSLFIEAPGGTYKVVVRPESGLTVRSWVPR